MSPIPPIKSRFFCDSDASDSSDAEEPATPPASNPPSFRTFIQDPNRLHSTNRKHSDTLTAQYTTYIQNMGTPDPASPTPQLEEYIDEEPLDDLRVGTLNRTVLEEYAERVTNKPDTYKWGAVTVLSRKLSPEPPSSSAFHREAYDNFFCSSAVANALKSIRSTACTSHATPSPRIINLPHIVEGEINNGKPLGYHLINPQLSVQVIARNTATGVFCGTFRLPNTTKDKFSSFFPTTINSEEALVQLIQTATPIAKNGNRCLWQTSTAPSFYLEQLLQERECIIQSAYPIFYFELFSSQSIFPITETITLTADEISQALQRVDIATYTKYTVQNGATEAIIVDIAPLFKDRTGIEIGIYLKFPK